MEKELNKEDKWLCSTKECIRQDVFQSFCKCILFASLGQAALYIYIWRYSTRDTVETGAESLTTRK